MRAAEHLEVHSVERQRIVTDDLHRELRLGSEVEPVAEQRDAERDATLRFRRRRHPESRRSKRRVLTEEEAALEGPAPDAERASHHDARAKTKQLRPDEVLGGTFTITNMGTFGTALTLPIINQPQVAILAADGVHKKPIVVEGPDGEDSIVIHHIGMVAMAWDHRAFDGAYAAAFLRDLKTVLETHDWISELA